MIADAERGVSPAIADRAENKLYFESTPTQRERLILLLQDHRARVFEEHECGVVPWRSATAVVLTNPDRVLHAHSTTRHKARAFGTPSGDLRWKIHRQRFRRGLAWPSVFAR